MLGEARDVGLSERLGPAAFADSEDHVFLGKEIGKGREHSDATAAIIDEEVQHLLKHIERQAHDLLEENRQRLDRLARALLDRETLEAGEVAELLHGS
jgi:cell division protease FtsH